MEFFVMINGELVPATAEQVFDAKMTLYDDEGKQVTRPEVKAVDGEGDEDELGGLSKTLEALNGTINGLGEKFKAQEEEVKKLKVAAQKGFVIPNPDGDVAKHTDNDNEVMKFLQPHYQRERQGKEFGLVVGEPVKFDFLGSHRRRHDTIGTVVEDWEEEIEKITTLETRIEGEGGAVVPVGLHIKVTEVGTLELWCVSREDGRRFKLEFNVRERDASSSG